MARVTQEHIDARLESIRSAAITMFVRKGVEGATMQEIAAEADLSAGAIYRYYPSKEHLLRAVWDGCTEEMHAMFSRVAEETPGSPLERIFALGRTVWEQRKQPSAAASIILQLETTLASARNPGSLGAERRTMRQECFGMVETFVKQAQDAGELDPEIDARALATALVACSDGLGIYFLEMGEELDQDGVLKVLTEMLGRLRPGDGRQSAG